MANSRITSLNWGAAIWAGIVAGVVATGAQMVLWWIFTDDLPEILYRDARLTAAMLMGPGSSTATACIRLEGNGGCNLYPFCDFNRIQPDCWLV